MTKSELIAKLAARYPQLVAKDAELAVKMVLDAMSKSLAQGQRIEIRGFGSFGLITARRAPAAIRSRARRSRCRPSTFPISRQAKSCANVWISRNSGASPRIELFTPASSKDHAVFFVLSFLMVS